MASEQGQRGTARPWLTCGLCVALVGCARQPEPASVVASPAEMQAKLEAALEARDERISQLENRMALLEAEARELRHRVQVQRERPLRETVRIGEDRRASRSTAQQPEQARPVLRLHGQGTSPTSPRRERRALPEVPVVHERLPVAPLPPDDVEALSAPPGDPREAYRAALDLVRRRDFDRALSALSAYLVRFPGDPRTARVLFWRGEVLFALEDYAAALASFQGALRADPDHPRTPDALLKVGFCHQRLGERGAARGVLRQLQTKFPDSDAAKLVSREDAS